MQVDNIGVAAPVTSSANKSTDGETHEQHEREKRNGVKSEDGQEGKGGKRKQPKDQDFYFNFYSSLQNQANMIGDIARTGTYRKAILGNAAIAFQDKVVLDVGAGSGILSYMSAQAGAAEVIALEASSMAEKMEILLKAANAGKSNLSLKDKVRVVRGMVEDTDVQKEVLANGQVDTIISEPIGVMLLHERMVESFLLARDLFLRPGGHLLPSAGQIFFCPFSDEGLYNETDQKAQFFNTTLFGTDFSELYATARAEVFAQPVVGMFPPASLVSTACTPKTFDFYSCCKEDLLEFAVPIDFVAHRTALVHGLASWFDLDFYPNPRPATNTNADPAWKYSVHGNGWQQYTHVLQESPLNPGPTPAPPAEGLNVKLSTGPQASRTHWQQARLLLPEPLAVNKGERLLGSVHFRANESRSYDLTLELRVDRPGLDAKWEPNPLVRKAEYQLQQQCFNYSYNPDAAIPLGLTQTLG